jgi:hypothetical protein
MADLLDLEVIREHMKQNGGNLTVHPPFIDPVKLLS